MSLTNKIVKEVYESLGKEKPQDNFFSRIAASEIDKIFEAQHLQTKLDYQSSGHKPTNITAAIVQKQIAAMY